MTRHNWVRRWLNSTTWCIKCTKCHDLKTIRDTTQCRGFKATDQAKVARTFPTTINRGFGS